MPSLSASEALNYSDREQRQQRGIWLTIAVIVAVIATFMGLFFHRMLLPRALSADELRLNRAIVFETPRSIEPFSLIDEQGKTFNKENLKGKWSLIYFGFTHCPDICPTSLAKLAKLMPTLDAEVHDQTQVILMSVDPARDTPEQLSDYVNHFNPEFKGLTGDFPEIMSFTRNVNVAFNKVMLDNDYTIDHTGHLVLINPDGNYHGFFKPPFELAALKLTFQSIVLYD